MQRGSFYTELRSDHKSMPKHCDRQCLGKVHSLKVISIYVGEMRTALFRRAGCFDHIRANLFTPDVE